MGAQSADTDSEDLPRETTTTAIYNGKHFHLFQVVDIFPDPTNSWPRTWMVVDLNGGVTVSSLSFDERYSYTPDDDEFDHLSPVTENGIPVYGY